MIFQFNIMQRAFPDDSPEMDEFRQWIPSIHALAEASEGFIWRATDERDSSLSQRLGDDFLTNLTAWESVNALYQFVFHPLHREIMMQRDRWFKHAGKPLSVMWHASSPHVFPTQADGLDRLEQLWRDGPSADAFDLSFAQRQGLANRDLLFRP